MCEFVKCGVLVVGFVGVFGISVEEVEEVLVEG